MKTKKSNIKPPPSRFEVLRGLIFDYAEAAVAASWKGGGDPADFELLEARLRLALLELNSHIEKMERDLS